MPGNTTSFSRLIWWFHSLLSPSSTLFSSSTELHWPWWGWFVAKREMDGKRKRLCGELSIILHSSPPHYISVGALICNLCAQLPDAIDVLCKHFSLIPKILHKLIKITLILTHNFVFKLLWSQDQSLSCSNAALTCKTLSLDLAHLTYWWVRK